MRVSVLAALAVGVVAARKMSTAGDGPVIQQTLVHASGVFPHITATAASGPVGPNVTSPRSECGIGAMLPWNDKLYVISYLSVPNAGAGTGLYSLDEDMTWTQVRRGCVGACFCSAGEKGVQLPKCSRALGLTDDNTSRKGWHV
jgi:hypothetical protein